MEKLLEVKGLKTHFKVADQMAQAVNRIDFDIYKGEVLGIVGESGSGKSVSALSVIQLIPNPPGEVVEGEIIFDGEKIFDDRELKKVKDTPEYRFFNKLAEGQRHFFSTLFIFVWIILHALLPIPGVIPFFISVIISFVIMFFLFYQSPRAKRIKAFRERIYTRMHEIRGKEIAMIFQEPMTSLNPVFTVGMQIIESLVPMKLSEYFKDWVINTTKKIKRLPLKQKARICAISGILVLFFYELISGWSFIPLGIIISFIGGALLPVLFSAVVFFLNFFIPQSYRDKSAKLFAEGVKLLDMVGIPDPEQRMDDYPHQFSGGMRQRAMIAMALAKNPSLLIADEPTTALDVTIQAQILELMIEIKNKRKEAAIVLITHDLAVIAETCERVLVMYGGTIQEVAEIVELFDHPSHPYTIGLLNSIPRPEQKKRERLQAIRGMVPNILNFPPGCKFCTRCDFKLDICEMIEPDSMQIRPGHFLRCHLYDPKYSEQLKVFKEAISK